MISTSLVLQTYIAQPLATSHAISDLNSGSGKISVPSSRPPNIIHPRDLIESRPWPELRILSSVFSFAEMVISAVIGSRGVSWEALLLCWLVCSPTYSH